jgi:hypothetical protein
MLCYVAARIEHGDVLDLGCGAPNYGSLNRKVMGVRWCGFRYPDHLNHFTAKALGTTAAKAGFGISFRWTGRLALAASDSMRAILTKSA